MMLETIRDRYINPYTDFGFKKLFGTEMNKELLISFLNALFSGRQVICDVRYCNSEHLGAYAGERRAIFDVYCENDRGEKFIVEMQNVYQQFFKDRSVYYASFPIREQAQSGRWDFELKAVYTIGILNFVFPNDEYPEDCMHHEIKLLDTQDHHVFFDKLTFIYLEMPKFKKREEELVTMFDKWLYVLSNLSYLMERPAALQERIFTRLFEQAEIARFSPDERRDYEISLNSYRDIDNAIETAKRDTRIEALAEGRAEGRAEGILENRMDIARKMRHDGVPMDVVIKYTGLAREQIEAL